MRLLACNIMHYTQRHDDRSRHVLLLRLSIAPSSYNIRLQNSRRVHRHVHLPRLECVHASHLQLALPILKIHTQHRHQLRPVRRSLHIVRFERLLIRQYSACSSPTKKRETEEVRTRVVLRTHRIRDFSLRDLIFRLQTHRYIFVHVLAVAEADVPSDQRIRTESVVLPMSPQQRGYGASIHELAGNAVFRGVSGGLREKE